ncbi:hypothetical protein EJ110_NYTH58481 [Nymphaea thermarum]|nr:hypothetical protein EJ110_NYTH58481 [Nymphaea thermarum]
MSKGFRDKRFTKQMSGNAFQNFLICRYVLGPVCWKGGITGNDMSLREMVDLVAKCDIAWHIQTLFSSDFGGFSRYDGDLVAKCYFAKRKLVWEVLEGGLKSKIEIQWSDITSFRTIYRQNHPDQLEVEVVNAVLNTPSAGKMKASNFAATFLKIGSWESQHVWDSFCGRGVSAVLALPQAFPPLPPSLPCFVASYVAAAACAAVVAPCFVASYAVVVSFASSPLAPSPLPLNCRRFSCAVLFLVFSGVGYCLSLVIAMAGEMTPKIDVAFDTGSNTKSENVPVQVTSIRLNKDNYLSWSAVLEIGITSRGRLPYITGEKPAPSKTEPRWATWALEDSQVKVWIISSVFADIQPLILRKSTSYDMWTVLARMYGCKKRVLRTYQIKRNIYSLKQGDLSVASFYAALNTKWEELDYHVNDDWNCGSDHALYWQKEWMDRTFIFMGGLCDEFESIRSQILNCDETPGIEEVYTRVESEEQHRQVMHIDSSHGSSPSAFVSRAPGTGQRPVRRCSHCNKLGHSVDFCWDIHPEKMLTLGRPPSSRRCHTPTF